ncbi:GlcG/HbpS family heme-binding protein [Pseudomonas urmiensis]|jgi:glc operon protein GlcG|uniref:Heme-binding protein n=1 Tax=Pseudomonas urmiensis TaxID=2745493 RepID=A0A923G4E4_9PSED|nr:heme-binding protein [Pseudomonas urmiensis]MBV4539165.1 heme-binding protein [Pseudomonas urmiensis]
MKTLTIAVLALLSFTTLAAPPEPRLELQAAIAMADAAQSAAQAQHYNIVISIHDQHGNLKYFRRMDNTSVGSIQVAQLKASTSASFPVESGVLAERSAGLPANPYGSIPGFLLLEGGLPIFDQHKRHVGSIGISGATPELDKAFAKAGVEAYTACKSHQYAKTCSGR